MKTQARLCIGLSKSQKSITDNSVMWKAELSIETKSRRLVQKKKEGWFEVCIKSSEQCIQVTYPCSTLQKTWRDLTREVPNSRTQTIKLKKTGNKLKSIDLKVRPLSPFLYPTPKILVVRLKLLGERLKDIFSGVKLQKTKSPMINLKGPPTKSSADNSVSKAKSPTPST